MSRRASCKTAAASLAEWRSTLQKARTAFGAGDYVQVTELLTGIPEKLDAATRETAAEVQRQGHRKK